MLARRSLLPVTLLLMSSVAAGAEVTPVGEWGDPQRLVVQGAEAFPVGQIRAEVERDLMLQVAAAPSAPLDKYLSALGERVAAGYRNCGFPGARAVALVDDESGQVILRVSEGPKFIKAGVKVIVGVGTFPADDLARRLTVLQPPPFFAASSDPAKNLVSVGMSAPTDSELPEHPTWEPGTSVSFERGPLDSVRKALRRTLGEMGFLRPSFDVRIERAHRDGVGDATLVVDLADPGPRAVLGALEIVGLSRNTEAAVRELCGLVEGRPLDVLTLQAVQQKLWDSARFKKHLLAARPAGTDEADKLTLRIELEELPAAPVLGAPLSELEQAMLRCRDYLSNMAGGQDDLVVEARSAAGSADSVFGFARGWAMRGKLAAAEAHSGAEPFEAGFAVTPDVIALYDLGAAARLSGETPESTLVVNASYTPAVDEKGRTDWVFNVGAWFKTQRRNEAHAPVRVVLRLAPVGFLDLAHDPKYGLRLRDGVVESAATGMLIRIDAATGRPLEVQVTTPAGTYAVRARRGALAQMAAGLHAGTTDAFDEAAPAGSVARFGLGLLCAYQTATAPGVDHAKSRRAAEAVRNLLTAEVTGPLERAFLREAAASAPPGKARFLMPPEFGAGPVNPQGLAALFALPYVNHLFPRGSWPWTVAREMLLVTGGRPSESAGEVSRVFESPDTGPLGFLVCAEILARADAKSAALFAQRGLRGLTPEDFERDWHALLGGDQAVPQFLVRVVRRLGEMEPQDVDALAAVLSPKQGAVLRRVAEVSRAAHERGPADLAELPRTLWDGAVGDYVKGRLSVLAGNTAPEKRSPFSF